MRYMALLALLSAAGLTACKNNPLAPTQTTAASSSPGAAAATPDSTGLPPDSLGVPADSTGDCEQTGENSGECGSQAADSTETPGSESPEAGESPDSGETSEIAGP
jgi:hypothetical protein